MELNALIKIEKVEEKFCYRSSFVSGVEHNKLVDQLSNKEIVANIEKLAKIQYEKKNKGLWEDVPESSFIKFFYRAEAEDVASDLSFLEIKGTCTTDVIVEDKTDVCCKTKKKFNLIEFLNSIIWSKKDEV